MLNGTVDLTVVLALVVVFAWFVRLKLAYRPGGALRNQCRQVALEIHAMRVLERTTSKESTLDALRVRMEEWDADRALGGRLAGRLRDCCEAPSAAIPAAQLHDALEDAYHALLAGDPLTRIWRQCRRKTTR